MASVPANSKYVGLARSLPPRLLQFFMRYPPSLSAAPSPQIDSLAANTSSTDANANMSTIVQSDVTPESTDSASSSSSNSNNPFLPFKNPLTQKWQPAAFSLRKQAELVKLAKKYNVVSLLPYTPKLPEEVARRRAEHGLRVKGTGVGQRVKGKMWERTLKGRLSDRQKAMEAMPEMIRHWKERGHGRGWKKWPK